MNKCNRCNVTEGGGEGGGGRGYEINKHLSGLLVYRLTKIAKTITTTVVTTIATTCPFTIENGQAAKPSPT